MKKLAVVTDPVLTKRLIQPAPGFAKKELATWHLELSRICAYRCTYCSSNSGTATRTNLARFMALAEAQVGAPMKPSTHPELTIVYDDAAYRALLGAELAGLRPGWGEGETIVVSMLTDAFSPPNLRSGLARFVVERLLQRTRARLRLLTKSGVLGSGAWLDLCAAYPERITVGMSIGTIDDDWAETIEGGTAPPSVRIRATERLHAAGANVFGMMCPVFPDMLQGDALERLVDAIQPARCDRVWAEPFNDRANWRKVREGYPLRSWGYGWFTSVYDVAGPATHRRLWSHYATELYERLSVKARREGWLHKLRYLLYEGDITEDDARKFDGLEGVLLQGTKEEAEDEAGTARPTGWSANPAIRALQRYEGHGCAGWPALEAA